MVSLQRNYRDHLGFWFGAEMENFGFDMKFIHFVRNNRGRKKAYRPKVFKTMHSLLVNGLENGFFSLDNLNETTTKSIYLYMSEGDPPAKVELNYPDRDWQKAWERLNSGILLPLAKEYLFFIMHDRVFTRERGYRLQFRNIDSPYCISCSVRSLDTVSYIYCEC